MSRSGFTLLIEGISISLVIISNGLGGAIMRSILQCGRRTRKVVSKFMQEGIEISINR